MLRVYPLCLCSVVPVPDKENRDYLAKARKSDLCLEESDKSPNGDKLSTSHQLRVNWAATKPDGASQEDVEKLSEP